MLRSSQRTPPTQPHTPCQRRTDTRFGARCRARAHLTPRAPGTNANSSGGGGGDGGEGGAVPERFSRLLARLYPVLLRWPPHARLCLCVAFCITTLQSVLRHDENELTAAACGVFR